MQQTVPGSAVDEAAKELRIGILNALGATLAGKRRDAVSARAASGIETEWQGDEEFYQGYDDANRHEFVNTASKPEGDGRTVADKDKAAGSLVFPNIPQPYVDAVAAREAEGTQAEAARDHESAEAQQAREHQSSEADANRQAASESQAADQDLQREMAERSEKPE